MLPYILALVALVLFGVAEFIYKAAHEAGMHEGSYLCLQSGIVFCTLGLFSIGGVGWTLTLPTVLLGLGCGICALATAVTMLIAIGRGPISVTAAVRRLGFILTGLLAVIFLGEKITPGKLVGVGLAVAGLLTMAWAPDETHRPHPIIYVAVVTSGVLAFGHKLGAIAGVSPSAFLMLQAGTVHLGGHAWCRMAGGYDFGPAVRRYAPVSALLISVAMTLAVYALRQGEATVLVPIFQLSFLVTAPLGFRLLREPVTSRKLLGLGLGAAAVLSFGLFAGPPS